MCIYNSQDDQENQKRDEERDRDDLNRTKEYGSITSKSSRGIIHCITIIGQIEGHYLLSPQSKSTKYEHILPQLVAVEDSEEIEGLLIVLNTMGGDVEAGLAISEMIAGMKKPTVSLVLGGSHSIGVPLAVSAKRSFIAPSATMTIHPVRLNGFVIGVEQTFDYFQKMQSRINNFITSNCKISEERLNELMFNTGELANDVGSILDGNEAVKEGIINEIGGIHDALQALYKMIENKRNLQKQKIQRKKETKYTAVKKESLNNTGESSPLGAN